MFMVAKKIAVSYKMIVNVGGGELCGVKNNFLVCPQAGGNHANWVCLSIFYVRSAGVA